MKKLFKFIIFLLILAVLGGAAYYVLFYDADEVSRQELEAYLAGHPAETHSLTGFSALADDEKQAYIRLEEAVSGYALDIELGNNNVSPESLKRIWEALLADNPAFFWCSGYEYLVDTGSNMVVSMKINTEYKEEQIRNLEAQIDQAVQGIIAAMPQGLDDYGKVKYFHDYIVINTEYDEASPENQNIISVFLNKRSVCAGYSKALQYLLDEVGIFSTYVTGEVVDRGPHAWNIVEMNQQLYYVDTTRDDPNFVDGTVPHPNFVEYVNFGVRTQDIAETHVIDDHLVKYPELVAQENNYYIREGRYYNFDNYPERLRYMDDLRGAALNGGISFQARFTDSAAIETAIQLLEADNILENYNIYYIEHPEVQALTFLIEGR